MKKKLGVLVLVGIAAFVGIQFVPVYRENPPVTGDIGAPPEVAKVLRNSCYDCHSHETKWPFYAYIAPASWFVTGDVVEGRVALNFSVWNALGREMRLEGLREASEAIEEGDMPLKMYLLANPGARLSGKDKETVLRWLATEIEHLKKEGGD